jgi:hypothetical protein
MKTQFSVEKWLSSVLIGSLSSNSEAIVTAQTALSSNYCFQNNMAAENPLASCKQIIEDRVNLFPKHKSTF